LDIHVTKLYESTIQDHLQQKYLQGVRAY